MRYLSILALALLPLSIACAQEGASPQVQDDHIGRDVPEQVLTRNLDLIEEYAASIEALLRPEPLLTTAQISAFNRFRNADQLAAARRLGVPQPLSEAAISRHRESGALVPLEDSRYWVVRELDYSVALVTPDVMVLLEEIGNRFHGELDRRGLPALRLEVTSVLRTAANQEALRRVNPNAAAGESTHQYGTTIDITYASFRAPIEPVVTLDVAGAPWLERQLRRVEVLAAETGAARMSRELQAILGHILRDMQQEGKVMVTMEIRQPVYHMTVARRLR
jgi:hypothetical protein